MSMEGAAGLDAMATREHDISKYCTMQRTPRHKTQAIAMESPKKNPLTKRFSGSSDDLYVGTRVSTVPEPEAYAIQVQLCLRGRVVHNSTVAMVIKRGVRLHIGSSIYFSLPPFCQYLDLTFRHLEYLPVLGILKLLVLLYF